MICVIYTYYMYIYIYIYICISLSIYIYIYMWLPTIWLPSAERAARFGVAPSRHARSAWRLGAAGWIELCIYRCVCVYIYRERERAVSNIYMYMCIYMYISLYIYIYMWRERERERKRERERERESQYRDGERRVCVLSKWYNYMSSIIIVVIIILYIYIYAHMNACVLVTLLSVCVLFKCFQVPVSVVWKSCMDGTLTCSP